MSTIKYNSDLTNNQFKSLVYDAEKQIRATYNIAVGIRSPYDFGNSSDITNLTNTLRNSNYDLTNYLNWIGSLKHSYEDIVNANILNMRAIDKIDIPVRDRVVIRK